MKTHEVISMAEGDLVSALKSMSLSELEKHAKQILKDLGADNYGGFMKDAMQELQAGKHDDSQFITLQNWLRDKLPNEAVMSDIYARLATILLMIISQKLAQISAKTS